MRSRHLPALRAPLAGALAALLAASAAAAQPAPDAYDCVIEPSLVTDLGSSADGLIAELLVARGDIVRAGGPVARLRSEVETVALEVARSRAESTLAVDIARARAELAAKEADRQRELQARRVAATAAVDQALSASAQAEIELLQAEHEQQMARLELNRSEISLGLRTVTSPVEGVVMRVMLSPGEYVYEQAKIARIARIDPLYVEVYLPIALYDDLKVGMEAEVRPADPVGGVHTARVIVVDKVFDSASDTFGVRLELPNPGSAMPAGINCNVTFPPGAG